LHALIEGHVFFAGDLAPGVKWINPLVTMGYDRNSGRLVGKKEDLWDQAIDQDWLVFYTHDPCVAVSEIAVEQGRYYSVKEAGELRVA